MSILEKKEKNLNNLIDRLSQISLSYSQSDINIEKIIGEKEQLCLEKNDLEKKNEELLREHKFLKNKITKLREELKVKNIKEEQFNQDIDELSQETESLLNQVNKWQM